MSGTIAPPSVGGIDSSIPLRAGQGAAAPQNPLATIGQFANVQNALNQAKLFPLVQQQMQTELNQRNLQYGLSVFTGLQSQIGNLIGTKGDINPKDVMRAGLDWAEGVNASNPDHPPIPMSQVVKMLSNVPMPDGDWRDQTYQGILRDKLKLAFAQTMGPVERLSALVGQPADVNQGSSVQPALRGGLLSGAPGAVVPAGAPYQLGLSPEAQAQPAPTRPATEEDVRLNPNLRVGQPINETTGQRVQQQGAGHLVNPPPIGQLPIAGLPPSLRNPVAVGAAPQPPGTQAATPAAPEGQRKPLAAALPPGASGALEGASADYQAMNRAAGGFQSRIFPLTQALSLFKGDKSPDTGPGSETVNHIRSFLLAQSPESLKQFLPSVGADELKVANYDQLAKYLAQYAANQPAAGGTDLRLMSTQLSQPNTHISKQAAMKLLVKTIGVERMQQAAVLDFNRNHGGANNAGNFGSYMTEFASGADPVGFAWDLLSPAERKAHFDALDERGKANYLASVRNAKASGLTGAQ